MTQEYTKNILCPFGHIALLSTAMNLTLITGGARSGKSRHALELASRYSRKTFIATAEAFDSEMQERIRKHQQERGTSFTTIEESINLADAIKKIPGGTEVAIIDCLTVWAGNLMHKHKGDHTSFQEIDSFLQTLPNAPCDLIIVTNEVGMGIVPENKMARQFRDLAGTINQQVAHLADSVILTVCGIPMMIK